MVQSQVSHHAPQRLSRETYTAVTGATYTAKGGDSLIRVNRAGMVTVTLPSAQVHPGHVYTIKDESGAAATNNITAATEGAETIDGSATHTISANYGSVNYYSDGSNWPTVPLLSRLAHQTNHNTAAADSLKPDDLAATDDNTDLISPPHSTTWFPKAQNSMDMPLFDRSRRAYSTNLSNQMLWTKLVGYPGTSSFRVLI